MLNYYGGLMEAGKFDKRNYRQLGSVFQSQDQAKKLKEPPSASFVDKKNFKYSGRMRKSNQDQTHDSKMDTIATGDDEVLF